MTFDCRLWTKALAAVAMVSLIAACASDLTGSKRRTPVQLSFTTKATTPSAGNLMAADLKVGPMGELVLQKVQLVFRKIELDRTGTAECIADERDGGDDGDWSRWWNGGDDDRDRRHGGDDDCEEVLRDPLLVSVSVDEAVTRAIEIPLSDGTFSELEAKLAPAKRRETAFNEAHPELVGKSVRVEGLFNGDPFVFTSRVRSRLEMEFDTPLVINDLMRNVTVSIDVRTWFLNSSGAVIDPSVSSNRQRIESNIRRSFRAFEDNDMRGDDDHGRHHGDNDGGHG